VVQEPSLLGVRSLWCGLEGHRLALAHENTEHLWRQLVDHLDSPGAGGTVVEQGVAQPEVEKVLSAGFYVRSDRVLRGGYLSTTVPGSTAPAVVADAYPSKRGPNLHRHYTR
jgi:hypothetical protein